MERIIIKEGNFLIVEEKNWINRICLIKLCDGDKCLALTEISTVDDKWVFNRIFTDEEHRAKGFGSEVLARLTDYLDQNRIILYAYIYSTGTLNEEQLLAWYERYGFIESNDGSYPLVRPYKVKTRKVSNDI